jgi:hypothetical protein
MVNVEESPDQSHRNQRVLKIKDKKKFTTGIQNKNKNIHKQTQKQKEVKNTFTVKYTFSRQRQPI